MTTLKDLFMRYLENQNKLVTDFNGKYFVIRDNDVVGVYEIF